jgi:hypothetical protein
LMAAIDAHPRCLLSAISRARWTQNRNPRCSRVCDIVARDKWKARYDLRLSIGYRDRRTGPNPDRG